MRAGMTQLILDVGGENLVMPESRKGGYRAYLDPGFEDVEMSNRRLVRELSGDVWNAEYQYNYFKPVMKSRVIAVCRKGQRHPLICEILPPESDGERIVSRFWVMKFTEPEFYWSKNEYGVLSPLWGKFSLTLREVEPSD